MNNIKQKRKVGIIDILMTDEQLMVAWKYH